MSSGVGGKVRRVVGAGLGFVTELGWVVLITGLVAWIGGMWWGWEELFVVAAIACVLFVLAVLLTLGGIDLEAAISVSPARVVAGERAAGHLTITNRHSRTARNLRVELPVGDAAAAYAVPGLKPNEATDELFVVPTHRRAVIPVGPLTTVQGDPLGLLRRTRVWTDVTDIYVHPATTSLTPITAGLIRDLEGHTTDALSPSDIAFHTLRDYVRGDELRHVHWRSSAKVGDLLVRQYNDTRRSHVLVLLSVDAAEYDSVDEFELAVSCAASVAVNAHRSDQTLTVIAGDEVLPTVHTARLLDRFSALEMSPDGGSIGAALGKSRRAAPGASIAVLCVGSTLSVADMRSVTTRWASELNAVIARATSTGTCSYRVIGMTRFVDVPNLGAFNQGLAAVVSA